MRGSPSGYIILLAVLRAIIAGPGDAMMIINGTVGRFVAIVNGQYPGLLRFLKIKSRMVHYQQHVRQQLIDCW